MFPERKAEALNLFLEVTLLDPAHLKDHMEGFAFDRLQDPNKSAKDAFAYLSNQAPPPPIHDKAALGQWFTQYIQPGMDAL